MSWVGMREGARAEWRFLTVTFPGKPPTVDRSQINGTLNRYLYISMSHSKPEMLDQHYTVSEVAKLLNVHEMTVRQWYSKNLLKIQRVGRKSVRIASEDLQKFLVQCNQERLA